MVFYRENKRILKKKKKTTHHQTVAVLFQIKKSNFLFVFGFILYSFLI